jgi:hypothetical protein
VQATIGTAIRPQQRIDHPHQRDRQGGHRGGGERKALPAADDGDPERSYRGLEDGQLGGGQRDRDHAAEEDDQVPPAPQPRPGPAIVLRRRIPIVHLDTKTVLTPTIRVVSQPLRTTAMWRSTAESHRSKATPNAP